MSEINKAIGSNLQILMAEKKIKVKDLAEKIGISATHLSYVINGKRNPSFELLNDLAKALTINVSDLIMEPTNENLYMLKMRKEDAALAGLFKLLELFYDRVERNFINEGTDENPDYSGDYEILLTKNDEEVCLSKFEYELLLKFISSNIPNYITLIHYRTEVNEED